MLPFIFLAFGLREVAKFLKPYLQTRSYVNGDGGEMIFIKLTGVYFVNTYFKGLLSLHCTVYTSVQSQDCDCKKIQTPISLIF